ncbi:hypothetical protein FOT80_19135 [Serratia fonticola]|nr:hypothetical protein [Serratia fonticola]NCG53527.1 hypothetical protein [Serratia fonticola]
MTISTESMTGQLSETLRAATNGLSSQLRVCLPGIIQSFNPQDVTCVVQLAINGQDGDSSIMLPLIPDLPVVFPRGGGVTLTFPIAAGDDCMVVFCDRRIDFWWQNGGVQEAVATRQHDLSDAFVIVGPQSQTQKISDISTTAAQLRSDDGNTVIGINPTSGAISGTAPGGFDLNGLKILPDGRLQLVGGVIVDSHVHGGVESGGNSTRGPQ